MRNLLTAAACTTLVGTQAVHADETGHRETIWTLLDVVNAYDADTVCAVLRPECWQHTPYIPDGAEGFLSLYPALELAGVTVETVLNLEGGNSDVAFNRWSNAEIFGHGCNKMVAFGFYEFHEDGRMSANWDAMMCDTPPNASSQGLTDNIAPITDLELTEENKAKLTAAFDVFITGTPEEAYATLRSKFHADCLQHNPDGSDGIEGFLAAQTSAAVVSRWQFTELHRLIGEGSYVLAISEGDHVDVHSVFYDLVRFEDGKGAAHWDVIQAVPTEGLANDNTMFTLNEAILGAVPGQQT